MYEMPSPGLRPPLFQVVDVARGGTIRFEPKAGPDKDRFLLPEGYYLLMPLPDRGDPRLIRAQVTEILPGAVAIASVGSGADGRLRVGDTFTLTRPYNATTAQIRSLPDVIPIRDKPDGSAAFLLETQRNQSIKNLRKIGQAIQNYELTNRQLPPAVVYGPDGKPWHSWRVLLLPYLDESKLYNDYDFTQPWDGEKNIRLLDKMPGVYLDLVHGDNNGHFTHYAALVGAWKATSKEVHTAFPPSGARMKSAKDKLFGLSAPVPLTLREATDGPSQTIAVAPVAPDRKIPWLKPEDIAVGPDFPGLGKPGGISTPYRTGEKLDGPRAAPVLMLDRNPLILLDTVEVDTLRSLTTRDAGASEKLDLARLPTIPVPAMTTSLYQASFKIRIDGKATLAWIER